MHVRAFVGHSFAGEDAELVQKFLRYFDQLQRLEIGFFWQNAEPAEPKVLADKVIALMSDKNTFIGICTAKERVIAPQLLKTRFVFNNLTLRT
jgi:hypothetical protein